MATVAAQVNSLQEQVRDLDEYVRKLVAQVQQLTNQQADDLKGYVEWSKRTEEQMGTFNEYVNVLAGKYNEMIRLMEERWL